MVHTPCEYHMGDELMKHVFYIVGSSSNGSPFCVAI